MSEPANSCHCARQPAALSSETPPRLSNARRASSRTATFNPAAFDDHVGSVLPDQLLDHQDVFGQLDDRNAQPRDFVGQLSLPVGARPQVGHDPESLGRVDVDLPLAFGSADLDQTVRLACVCRFLH